MIRSSGVRRTVRGFALGSVVIVAALAFAGEPGRWPGDASAQGQPIASEPEAELNSRRVQLYHLQSAAGGELPRSVRVCLPREYTMPGHEARRYPVVYLLHGWPGGDGNWPGQGHAVATLDSLTASGEIPPVIAVMPNGSGAGLWGRSLYLNSYDGKVRLEDFMAYDLVAWTDSLFRTVPDSAHRAVIGLSEGATGALNLAFLHPHVFNACGGLSGQYELARDIGMKAVFGPEPGGTLVRQQGSPTLYVDRIVDQLKRQTIYFDCGLEDGDLEDNRALHRRLVALGVPHTYREYPGHHGWGYWRKHLRDALIVCLTGMR